MKLFILSFAIFALAFSAIIPPEANLLFPDYVFRLGYPVQSHHITTDDGYINLYFRIQAKNT